MAAAVEPKTFDALVADLRRAAGCYEGLLRYFGQFCREADRFNEPTSPVKGLAVTRSRSGDHALQMAYLDRTVRVSMRFDRKALGGVLHVEDVSDPTQPPKTLARIPFEQNGDTDIGGGYTGKGVNLGLPADCKTLALRCVDLSLDFDPWA